MKIKIAYLQKNTLLKGNSSIFTLVFLLLYRKRSEDRNDKSWKDNKILNICL